ncbi:MAG: T9SS type A sorting domain-containing protein, partial [Bacteroidia bacterium]
SANNDLVLDLDIDNKGIIHCTSLAGFGTTFPITSNARNKSNPKNGAYTRFDRNGNLLYSTFTPLAEANLATDTLGTVYLFGRSSGFFPLKGNSFQTTRKGFSDFGLMCFNNKDTLVWSTLLGGSDSENGRVRIDVNPKGDKIALVGFAQSTDYPLKKPYADSATTNFNLLIVASCFKSNGNLMWSTYLCPPSGTNGFAGIGISFINDDKLAIGSSNFQNNFPDKKNTWIRKANLQGAFMAIFDTAGTAQRVSFDSPQSQSFGRGITDITVDKDLNLHVVCEVSSDSIRTTADALKKQGSNFYIGTNQGEIGYMVMDTSLNIKYATYIGGKKSFDNTPFISVNSQNEATIILSTVNNSDFPTKNAYQGRLAGASDIALLQFGCNYEPRLSLPKGATICKGDSVALKVDSGFAKYEWSPVKNSGNTLIAKDPGKYYVIITDSNGCSGGVKDSFELTQFTPLNPTIQSLDPTQFCSGDSARLRGRVTNFKSLKWSNGDTTLRTAVFKSGKYFLTAIDSNGCLDTSNNINIQAIPKPNPVIMSNTGSTNFCRKFNQITLDVGTGYNAYKWSTGATTNSIKVAKTGWYKVVVFNGFNCSDSDSVFVSNTFATPPVISSVNPVKFCNGDSVTFTAPAGYSNFLWSTGSSNQSIKVGKNRNVFLIATDTNGCTDTSSIITTQKIIDSLKIKASAQGPFCFYETLNLQVDTGFTAYKWSTGDTTRAIGTQQSGNYYVTALSLSGCKVQSDTFTADFFAKSQASILYNKALKFCADDSIRLYFSGAFNSFSWANTTATTQSFYANQSGVYTLNIIDTNNCRSVSDSVKITVDPLPIAQVTSNKGLSFCNKDSVLIGTNKNFSSYKWSNGQSSRSFYIKKTASLWVEVTDNNGCSNFSDTLKITKFDLPDTAALTIGATTFCQGDSFIINLKDTTNTVNWNDRSTDFQKVINTTGSYKAILKNKFGCVDSTRAFNITVNSNPQPKLTVNGALNYCENLGPRLITTTNKYASYLWNTSRTSDKITTNTSGTYYVSVTDNNGCKNNSDTIKINKYNMPDTTAFGIGSTTFCQGDSFIINLNDSTSTISWNDNNSSINRVISNTGSYKAILRTKFGCVDSTRAFNITVNSNPQPKLAANGPLSFCENLGPRLISTTNQYVSYIWNTSQNASNISTNASGNYYVSVIDSNGCIGKSDTFSLNVYNLPNPEIIGLNGNSFCQGDSSFITTKKSYTKYLWSNKSTSSGFMVKQDLSLVVDVTDSNGCVNQSSPFRISVLPLPSPFSISALGKSSVCFPNTVSLVGPSNQSKYIWSNGSSNNQIKLDSTQKISLTVQNVFGCKRQSSDSFQVYVGVPAPLTFEGNDSFCLGDSFYVQADPNYSAYSWSNGNKTSNISIKVSDTFYLKTTDSIGCIFNSDTFYTNARPLLVPRPWSIARGKTSFCNGDSLELLSPSGYEQYLWSNGKTSTSIFAKQSGSYEVIVIDSAGCRGRSPAINVTVFDLPQPIITSANTPFCTGDTFELALTKPYANYLWSTSSFDSTIKVTQSDIIKVIVQDTNQCFGESKDFNVEFYQKPSFIIDTLLISGNCNGDSMTLLITSDNTNNKILWTDSTVINSKVIKSNERYGFTVTNISGCTKSLENAAFSTFENPLPSILINGNDSICVGESVELSLINSYNQILWKNSINQETISVSSAGYNSVLVTDNNGCQGMDSAFITTIALPVAKLNFNESVSICPSDSVLLEPTSLFANYQWNNGATESSIWVMDNGTFWLDVTNDFGCTNRSDTVNVEIKQIPDSIRLIYNDGVISANTDSIDVYNWYKNSGINAYDLVEQQNKKLRINESNFYFLSAQFQGCKLISDTIYVEYYDSSKLLDFAVYPNPTMGNIFINIDAVNPSNVECLIIDAQGRIVKTFDFGVGDKLAEEMDLTLLNKGVYQVKLVNGDQILT